MSALSSDLWQSAEYLLLPLSVGGLPAATVLPLCSLCSVLLSLLQLLLLLTLLVSLLYLLTHALRLTTQQHINIAT